MKYLPTFPLVHVAIFTFHVGKYSSHMNALWIFGPVSFWNLESQELGGEGVGIFCIRKRKGAWIFPSRWNW